MLWKRQVAALQILFNSKVIPQKSGQGFMSQKRSKTQIYLLNFVQQAFILRRVLTQPKLADMMPYTGAVKPINPKEYHLNIKDFSF
ncbi:MAG: hypothetical protein EGQ70_09275 [Faecalibacterium prausnitzii]|nr:hypothetical protein [Faecalibacterium prausnitzii]